MDDKSKTSSSGASLKPAIQAKLGQKLKEVYSDVINEPVPDRFVDLLNKLEQSSDDDSKTSS